MNEHIPASLARQVRRRARNICEYCKLPQVSQEAAFHVDHIRPRVRRGATTLANLALACVTCSLWKGARERARDIQTERVAKLFHPRRDVWSNHFRWTRGWRLVGLTPTGRATIAALGMIRPAIVAIRRVLVQLGGLSDQNR
jgi:hypothetical protein